jgi:hypothetical protein
LATVTIPGGISRNFDEHHDCAARLGVLEGRMGVARICRRRERIRDNESSTEDNPKKLSALKDTEDNPKN